MALSDNLISQWKFNESSGNADDSGSSNTLTNNNSAVYTAGKVGNCIDLEASSSQYFSITDIAQTGLDLGTTWTIAFWINFESDSADQFIVGKYTGASERSYLVYRNFGNGTLNLSVSSDGTSGTTVDNGYSFSPTPGTWYHIIVTFDSGTGVMYVNNSQIGTSGGYGTPYNSTADFVVGQANGGNYVDGKIDALAIWSRVITSSERAEIYNSGNGYEVPDIVVSTDTAGVPVESVVFSYLISGSEVAGAPVDAGIAKYGFSNQQKNSNSWINQTKS